jgi:hypothetical protein
LGADLEWAKAAKKKDQPFSEGYVRPWRGGDMEVPINMAIISNQRALKPANPALKMLPFFRLELRLDAWRDTRCRVPNIWAPTARRSSGPGRQIALVS